jgi:hypothetical protein
MARAMSKRPPGCSHLTRCTIALPPKSLVGLCMSSVLDLSNPRCTHSASLGRDCAVSPDGPVYVRYENGDEYVSGAGWRSMHYPSYSGSTRPRSADLTADDMLRCLAALCAPACVGGNPIAVHGVLCAPKQRPPTAALFSPYVARNVDRRTANATRNGARSQKNARPDRLFLGLEDISICRIVRTLRPTRSLDENVQLH